MIKKIDSQLETYDQRVGASFNTIQTNAQGQISLQDLKKAMGVIKHKPDDETIEKVVKKLDVDQDGFVVRDDQSADPFRFDIEHFAHDSDRSWIMLSSSLKTLAWG